ncbi:hypothetical protein [Legionella clemsonensis]|uniref:Uncharacterized protein n=1 Tax=Legionella clemsonensis TaxID=1867846 RepID=A0A222P1D8_9GAMM|nr:hypothetical protein [Legionella clemsonensis]ASQ45674.1 hypothetical protein clem_05590 [Legionella clemsonensis]
MKKLFFYSASSRNKTQIASAPSFISQRNRLSCPAISLYGINTRRWKNKKESLDSKEGEKAISLAKKFESLTIQFAKAHNETNNADIQHIKDDFRDALNQGYQDMKTHRARWKPILANIAIAATGIGLLALIAKYLSTGSTFFSATNRQKMVNSIDQTFDSLSPSNQNKGS